VPHNIFLVQSDPVLGREDEYNRWYTEQHLPEVLALPGFVAAQRFRTADFQRPGNAPAHYRYIAIYEIDGSPEDALRGLDAALGTDIVVSEALDPERVSHLFESITDRVVAPAQNTADSD
jgi:hypothetical protein